MPGVAPGGGHASKLSATAAIAPLLRAGRNTLDDEAAGARQSEPPQEKDLLRSVLAHGSEEPTVRRENPCYRDGEDSRLFIRSKTLRDEVQ